jgi:hypothetical protein
MPPGEKDIDDGGSRTMTMIMVSYRRSDAQDMAGRISDYLISKYGEKSVFFDVESIETGADYRRGIEDAIRASNVVIAVIGQQWLGKKAEGQPRIFDPRDPVRAEIETALTNKVPIFPVLVNGATMPEETDLPDALRELHYHNALKIDSGQDFRMHMARLATSINGKLGISATPTNPPTTPPVAQASRAPIYIASVASAVAAVGVILWAPWESTPTPPITRQVTALQTPQAPTPPPPTPNLPSPQMTPVPVPTANSGFVFPDSDRRILSPSELRGLSKDGLRYARNELYARHGHIFVVDPSLAQYYSQFPWYRPSKTEGSLNEFESKNLAIIMAEEKNR